MRLWPGGKWKRASAFLALAALLVPLAMLTGATLARRWSARPDWRAVSHLRDGMTRAEVEAIVGCPPGDYGTHEPERLIPDSMWTEKTVTHWEDDGMANTAFRWTDDQRCLFVVLDDRSGRVVDIEEPYVRWEETGLMETLRWRVGRLWRTWFPE